MHPPSIVGKYLFLAIGMVTLLISAFLVVTLFNPSLGLWEADLPPLPEDGELWAVLVAGSNTWFNYRHQADVCHSYQVLSRHGIPDDHIIVMMYDDIAHDSRNPTPGVVINHPNGTDVYHGVPKDYTCTNVNPDVFLSVLKGEQVMFGSGKTLKSGPKDHVFVYFADHGAPGLVAFGEDLLKAKDLISTIKFMVDNKKFAKLVFYLEACESGSMFKGLLDPTWNVFATTASNSTSSSYACYYDDARKTFLGDVYSIKWLEDSDKKNIEMETLEQQYHVVKKETNTSTVCQFGDMSISKMPVGYFQGTKQAETQLPPSYYSCGADAVPGPEVPVHTLKRIIASPTATQQEKQEAREELDQLIKNRNFLQSVVVDIVSQSSASLNLDLNSIFKDTVDITKYDCYYAAVDAFHGKCFNLGKNDYALRSMNVFVNLCENNVPEKTIVDTIKAVCTHPTISGIY